MYKKLIKKIIEAFGFKLIDKNIIKNYRLISKHSFLSLDKVLKIRGVTFDWKSNQDVYKGRDVGVIAQEVEKVLPEIVENRKTGKAVKYEKLTPLLIEAIKEQNKTIEALKKQIGDLTLAVNKLQ